ncbi:MAG: type IV pilus twitching motility protein PilT [Planctomycetota bacterium]
MDKNELESLLETVVRTGGSSLHLIPGRPPCIRVQRRFLVSEHEPVSQQDVEFLSRDFLFEDHRFRLHTEGRVEVLFLSRTGRRFRTTVAAEGKTLSLSMRPVAERPPTLDELELPPQIADLTRIRSGLVLLTGFFGAGKTATLAAAIDCINRETSRNLVSLESPIEYVHQPARALLHQREIGVHVDSFASGVTQAVRVGADVIGVGDIEDAATLDAVLTACESGCLVLACFEASSVVGACEEMPNLVLPELRERTRERFASSLQAVVAQTLLPRSHDKGRVPLVEILMANSAVRQAVAAGRSAELPAIMARFCGIGMQTAEAGLRDLLARHLITPEEARNHSAGHDPFAQPVPAASLR